MIQTGLTAVCKIQARIAGELPTIECALGWVQHNRYCRVRIPEGLIGHNGPSALGFLNVARNAIRGLMPEQALGAIQPSAVPGFRIDMSWLVIDRESECYLGLRSIFSSLVAITAFMPLVEPELNDIMAYHMAIALPASVIDGLMSGGATAIPTPLAQLNPCYGIDSCLRKLSHWYFQDCFSSTQCKEFVKIVIYKPLHLDAIEKFPDGMQSIQGVPPVSLLTDDGAETPLHDERNIANQQRLSKNDKDILIAAATEIAKKRKDFSE
eukprot:s3058_g18.t1